MKCEDCILWEPGDTCATCGTAQPTDNASAILRVLQGAAEGSADDDLAQLRRDAAIGRALREAATADVSDEPLIHITWTTGAGRTSGRYLGDPRLHFHRRELAEAAEALLEHLQPSGKEGLDGD